MDPGGVGQSPWVLVQKKKRKEKKQDYPWVSGGRASGVAYFVDQSMRSLLQVKSRINFKFLVAQSSLFFFSLKPLIIYNDIREK